MAIDAIPGPLSSTDTVDTGDDTFRRFRYQATYAATVAVGLLQDTTDVIEIYCEQYEDILLRLASGKLRGIQVKTKSDDGKSPRATDDVIKDALLRFIDLELAFPDAFDGFTLASNSAFDRSGKGHGNLPLVVAEARAHAADRTLPCEKARKLARALLTRLKQAVRRPRRAPVAQAAQDSASTPTDSAERPAARSAQPSLHNIPLPTEADALRVLQKLDILDDLPKLPDIRGRLREQLVKLSTKVSGSTYSAVETVVDALEHLAYLASSRADEDSNGRHWFVASPDRRSVLNVTDEIRRKCLTRADVESAINKHCAGGLLIAAAPVTPGQIPPELSVLEKKLVLGGLSVGTISVARDAVASTEEFGARLLYVYEEEEGLRRYNHARAVAKKESVLAYEAQAATGTVNGPQMLRDIEIRIKERRASDPTGVLTEGEEEHLLGHVFSLTSECVVWWSTSRALTEEALSSGPRKEPSDD